jgi:nucleotide-binding universal stress UspA family protein
MKVAPVASPVQIAKILFLTDFSEASNSAQAYALAMAREHAASVEILHVLTPVIPESCPEAIKADEDLADSAMQDLQLRFGNLATETVMSHEPNVWAAVRQAIEKNRIDLLVLGTHGRTGAPRLLLGSVAEQIFRCSPIPVLTVGPKCHGVKAADISFNRVLFCSDFSPESKAAAAYALSLAQERHMQLIAIHVMPRRVDGTRNEESQFEESVAEAISQLYQLVPVDSVYNPPEVAVEYGEPAERIVKAASERDVDLIVMGIRGAAGHLGAATHLERVTAHQVVAHAHCPVLTVRA